MKKDIANRQDLEIWVRAFYTKLLGDEKIGFIFTEIAQLDLETHIPHLVDFWENTLLKPNGYKRNVLKIHLDLNTKENLTPAHFEQWLGFFDETTDELFEGEVANKAKNRARSIATVMQIKIHKKGLLD